MDEKRTPDDLFSGEEFVDQDNDLYGDVEVSSGEHIVVYSRDWTVETIYNQIRQGNIELNPKFQRRNAWKEDKRSRLVESFVLGLPVPEIVLAEDPKKPKSFIVIDGKQRLLTIAGFIQPDEYDYWDKAVLHGLNSRRDLNGVSYRDLQTDPARSDDHRYFLNADMRCTVISGFDKNDVLYDIFYRLNTGSESLSTQELRQVLHRGPFADFLFEITQTSGPIHDVLGLDEPDPRLYDMEFILRFISFRLFGDRYSGNLKRFLDDSMGEINDRWKTLQTEVEREIEHLNRAARKLKSVFDISQIGRRFRDGQYLGRVNKVLLEAQLFFFGELSVDDITPESNRAFVENYQLLFQDLEFIDTISGSTKDVARYRTRCEKLKKTFEAAYDVTIDKDLLTGNP